MGLAAVFGTVAAWCGEMELTETPGDVIDWIAITARQPVLGTVPQGLREAARLMPVAGGRVLARRGERPKVMWCVLAGEVRLIRTSCQGIETILQRTRGGFIAEASLDVQKYHCDLVAATSSQLLSFPLAAFRQALDQDASFRRAWIAGLAREVRALRGQCERLGLKSAAQRILHYLEAEGVDGTITLAQSRKSWAAELGLTHEVLYRTLRRLREAGVLRVEGKRIILQTERQGLQ